MPDPNTNPNPDPNVDPNAADPKPDGDPKPNSAEETYTLTVNGEKREVTLAEMQELAAKSAGADAKFREASEMRQTAAEGIRFKEMIGKLNDEDYKPSDAEARELASLAGIDPNEFLAMLHGDKNVDDNNDEGQQTQQAPSVDFAKEFESMFGMAPGDAKEILSMSHQSHVDNAREKIRAESDNAVDKDELFGKMIVGEHGKDRAEVIKEMVAEDVFRRIRDGESYGAELIGKSVQTVRSRVKRFGMPAKPDQQLLTLGPGPSEGLPAEVQSETPIKRIDATERGAESNFVARWMQKALQVRRNAGSR